VTRTTLVLVLIPVFLASLAFVSSEAFEVAVSWALVLSPAVNLAVALLLRLAVRYAAIPPRSLVSRAQDALVLWLAASIGGVLGLARLAGFHIPLEAATGLLALALLLISVPAVLWLILWWELVSAAILDWRDRVREMLGR